MNNAIQHINLDINDSGNQVIVFVRRRESARQLAITLSESGKPYTIPTAEGSSVAVGGVNANGTTFLNRCTVENNTVYYLIPSSSTGTVGTVQAAVRVQEGFKVIATAKFAIRVMENVVDETAAASSEEYTALTQLIEEVQEALSAMDATKITEASASVENVTGTPSCTVTLANATEEGHEGTKKLVFVFSGIKGEQGEKGETGDRGAKGDKGDKGERGFTGERGPKGDTGAQGEQGEQGIRGEQGIQGVSGVYVGAGPIPDGYNVQINPNGSADELVTEAPNDGQQYARKNKAWAALGNKADASALELTNKLLALLAKLTKGQAWDTEAGTTPAYEQTVPAGAKAVAVKSIGGKTVEFNQLVQNGNFVNKTNWTAGATDFSVSDNIATVAPTGLYGEISQNTDRILNGHKYFCSYDINRSEIGSSAANLHLVFSVVNTVVFRIYPQMITGWQRVSGIYNCDRSDITRFQFKCLNYLEGFSADIKNVVIIDLTQMFGVGNEPQTVEECKAILPNDYYPYNVGELVSAEVVSVDSTDSDSTTLGTIAIPAEVRALEGYGQSHGSDYNYLDFETKKYVEVGHYVNGVWTAHAQETDVSAYIGDDNLLTVEDGGKLTFTQSNLTVNIPVPNDTEYAINLSEATASGPLFASAPYMGGTPPSAPYYEPEIDGVPDDT